MTNQEIENHIKNDQLKRNDILKEALLIVFDNNVININNSIKNMSIVQLKQYYIDNFYKYNGNMLTQEKYKPSDFWFNDAGFQFKWRNFEGEIQLECITWNQVKSLLNTI